MQYGEILTKSLAISWRHKYLWLLALFAGEGAAGLALITAGVVVAAIIVGALLGVVWLAVILTASGAIAAFTSTYWTLGYKRLDLEPQPMALTYTAPPTAA